MTVHDETAFTLRIPSQLCDIIDEQRKILRRSRNAQILYILETYFETQARNREQVIRELPDPSPIARL